MKKNLHTTVSFLHTQLFFLEIYFFKNEFIQSQNKQKKMKKKKTFTKIPFFFSSQRKNSPPLIKTVEILY